MTRPTTRPPARTPQVRVGTRILASGVLGLALATSLTACGDDQEPEAGSATTSPYAPTETPTVPIEMGDPPADFTEVEGEGFTISAPPEFQQLRETSSNGEPMLVLESPSSVEGVPQRVAVIRDVQPVSSAAEQSFALESAKSAAGPGAEVTRVEIPAPEGQSAYLTTWTEVRAAGGQEQVEVTYWQLMQQVDEDLILNVVAFAPAADFETSDVSTILRSFAPEGTPA